MTGDDHLSKTVRQVFVPLLSDLSKSRMCESRGCVCVWGGGACVVSAPSPGSAALSSGSWKECGVGIRSPELESHLQP